MTRRTLAVVLGIAWMVAVTCGTAMGVGGTAYTDATGAGNWSTPSAWDQNSGYPGQSDPLDTATLDSGTMTVDVDVPLMGAITVNNGGKVYSAISLSQDNQVTVNNGGVVEFKTNWKVFQTYEWDLTLNDGSLFYANCHEDGTINSDITIGAGATTTIRHNGGNYNSADLAGVITGPNTSTVDLTRVGSSRDMRLHGDNAGWLSNINVKCPITLYNSNALGTNAGAGEVKVITGGRVACLRAWKASNIEQPRDLTMEGGSLYSRCHSDGWIKWTGTINLKSDTTISVYNRQYEVGDHYFDGQITEDATPRALTFNIYGDGTYPDNSDVWLRNSANNFTGGLHVKGGGRLRVTAAGACGDGPVYVYGDTELQVEVADGLDADNVLYLLAGSNGLLDLNEDCEVLALNLGGTYNDVSGEVEGGDWISAGTYFDGPEFTDYIQFDGQHGITVLTGPAPIPEPAALGMIGLALLSLRKRKS